MWVAAILYSSSATVIMNQKDTLSVHTYENNAVGRSQLFLKSIMKLYQPSQYCAVCLNLKYIKLVNNLYSMFLVDNTTKIKIKLK